MATGGGPNQAGGGGDSVGTLFVDIDARLDRFDQRMRELEEGGSESAQRVERAMADTAGATREVEGAADGATSGMARLLEAALKLGSAIVIWRKWGGAISAAGKALGFVLSTASNLIRPLTSIVGVLGLFGQALRAIRNLPELFEAIRDAILNLPQTISSAARSAQDAFGSLVLSVGVLRETLGRTASEIGALLGNGDVLGDIDALSAAIERSEQRFRALQTAAEASGDAITKAAADARQAQRDLALQQAEGPVERARTRASFAQQDVQRNADRRVREVQERFASELDRLRQQRDAGEISPERFERQADVLNRRQGSVIDRIRQEAQQQAAATREANQLRIAEARRQAQQQERQAEQSAEAEAEARRQALQGALSRERELRLRMAGRTAAAEAEAIRRQFDQRIQRALDDNNRALAASLERRKRLRVEAAKEEVRAEAEARREAEREERRDRLSDRRDVQAQIEAERARQAGNEDEARRIEIGRRFERRINEAERNGRDAFADQLRQLRDLRLQAVGDGATTADAAQARRGDFLEVGRARIAAGGPGSDEQRVHDPENEKQTEILAQMLKRMRKGNSNGFATT